MKTIVWAKSARNGLQKIYEFIYENSRQNADEIVDEIALKVGELLRNPERYKSDEYKRNNTGLYRAFEHKKVRVSYKINVSEIRIVRVKHTKQKPKSYYC